MTSTARNSCPLDSVSLLIFSTKTRKVLLQQDKDGLFFMPYLHVDRKKSAISAKTGVCETARSLTMELCKSCKDDSYAPAVTLYCVVRTWKKLLPIEVTSLIPAVSHYCVIASLNSEASDPEVRRCDKSGSVEMCKWDDASNFLRAGRFSGDEVIELLSDFQQGSLTSDDVTTGRIFIHQRLVEDDMFAWLNRPTIDDPLGAESNLEPDTVTERERIFAECGLTRRDKVGLFWRYFTCTWPSISMNECQFRRFVDWKKVCPGMCSKPANSVESDELLQANLSRLFHLICKFSTPSNSVVKHAKFDDILYVFTLLQANNLNLLSESLSSKKTVELLRSFYMAEENEMSGEQLKRLVSDVLRWQLGKRSAFDNLQVDESTIDRQTRSLYSKVMQPTSGAQLNVDQLRLSDMKLRRDLFPQILHHLNSSFSLFDYRLGWNMTLKALTKDWLPSSFVAPMVIERHRQIGESDSRPGIQQWPKSLMMNERTKRVLNMVSEIDSASITMLHHDVASLIAPRQNDYYKQFVRNGQQYIARVNSAMLLLREQLSWLAHECNNANQHDSEDSVNNELSMPSLSARDPTLITGVPGDGDRDSNIQAVSSRAAEDSNLSADKPSLYVRSLTASIPNNSIPPATLLQQVRHSPAYPVSNAPAVASVGAGHPAAAGSTNPNADLIPAARMPQQPTSRVLAPPVSFSSPQTPESARSSNPNPDSIPETLSETPSRQPVPPVSNQVPESAGFSTDSITSSQPPSRTLEHPVSSLPSQALESAGSITLSQPPSRTLEHPVSSLHSQ